MQTLCLALFALVSLGVAAKDPTFTCQLLAIQSETSSSKQGNVSLDLMAVQFNLSSITPVVVTPFIPNVSPDIYAAYFYPPTYQLFTVQTVLSMQSDGFAATLQSTLYYFDEKHEQLVNVTQNVTSTGGGGSSGTWAYTEHNMLDNEGNLWIILSQLEGSSVNTDMGIAVFNATTRMLSNIVPFVTTPSSYPVQVLTTVQGVSGLSYITADGPMAESDSTLANVRIITYGVSNGGTYNVTYNVSLSGLPADMIPSAAFVTNIEFGEVVIFAMNFTAGTSIGLSGEFALYTANLYEDSDVTPAGETRVAPKGWEAAENLLWNDGTAWWVLLFNANGEVRYVQVFNDGSTPNWYPKFSSGFSNALAPTDFFICLPE